jgi:hypothetical protein
MVGPERRVAFSAKIDPATLEALRAFAKDAGMTMGDAANLCLASGLARRLGKERVLENTIDELEAIDAEVSQEAEDTGHNSNGEGTMITIQAGMMMAASDHDDPYENAHVDELIATRLWGFFEEESAAVAQCPEFLLLDPATVRPRLTGIIEEAGRLGLERPSKLHALYVQARVGGLTGEEAQATLHKHGPFAIEP